MLKTNLKMFSVPEKDKSYRCMSASPRLYVKYFLYIVSAL